MAQRLNLNKFIPGLLLAMVVLFLILYYLLLGFAGMTHSKGMEQADIARHLATGKGFSTQVIRPVQLTERIVAAEAGSPILEPIAPVPDTIHAPLSPFISSLAFRLTGNDWTTPDTERSIYFYDYVVSAISVAFLLLSIWATYLLVSSLFDAKLAFVTCILMVLCQTLWRFAQSGLAQNHMVFFMTMGLFLLHRAHVTGTERSENGGAGKSPLIAAIGAGVMFSLLMLSHWIALWPILGIIIMVASTFKSRGPILIGLVVPVVLGIAFWALRNTMAIGDPIGLGKELLFSGFHPGGEETIMRNAGEEIGLRLDGLPSKLVLGILGQMDGLFVALGSVCVAPLFFLAIFHRFRQPATSLFRWVVLVAWLLSALAMAIYGAQARVAGSPIAFNQLHIIFTPVMSAYGLALLSVLWGRLGIKTHVPFAKTGHIVAAVVLTALPLLLSLPGGIKDGLYASKSNQRRAVWPPFFPPSLWDIATHYDENKAIFSDSPWGSAWYGDIPSIWLPTDNNQLLQIHNALKDSGTPTGGCLLTPETTYMKLGGEILNGRNADWSRLILRGPALLVGGGDTLAGVEFPFKTIHQMWPKNELVFYGDERYW